MPRTLNGTTDRIVITGLAPDLGATYGLWCWVRVPSIAGGLGGFIMGSDNGGGRNFQFKRVTGDDLQFIGFVGGNPSFKNVLSVFAADTWTFVGGTRRGGTFFMVHGTEAGNLTEVDLGSIGVNDNDPQVVEFGSRSGGSEFFAGDLAWGGIINDRSLTLADFNRISRRGWDNPSLFTLPMYGEDSPEPDLSGNGNTGTLTGTTQTVGGPPMGPPFGVDETQPTDLGEPFLFKNVVDTLGLEILPEVAELFIESPVINDNIDALALGDFAEIEGATALKLIETPAEALVLGDSPDTAFSQGPVTTGKTLMIAEFKLAGGTLFRAAKGIRHPERFYRGTVISFGSIIKSIPIPAGLPQISDASVTLADTDGELRQLMSIDPPQNREVVLKIGDEGASEAVFQTIYTGVITHVTFPPGQAQVFLRDISFQFLNEMSPNLLTRDNFIADPLWAKNLLGRSEGRFEETEIFSPIVFGIVNSDGLDTPGAINAVRLDSTTFNLAQHPIDHSEVRLFKKDPRTNDTTFTQITGGVSIVQIAKTIDGVDFIFTQAVFGSARSEGYELRWDGTGMTDDGTRFGTVVRNPVDCLRLYLTRIAQRDLFEDLDVIQFTEQAETVSQVTTGGPTDGFFCDGAIAQRMTHKEAITRILTSFNLFLFTNKVGKLTPRYIGSSDPNRQVLDDVQDIYRKTETHALARPIINDINLQFFRTYSDQSWNSQLTVDDPLGIATLGRRETRDLKLFFVRDDFVADRVARDFLQFSSANSFRIVFTAPGHRDFQGIDLATLIGITSYSGPDPSGLGYDNLEFLIHKLEFNTDNKQLKVHAIARVTPPSLGLTESTSLEFTTIVAADGMLENGNWLELTGRPPVDEGFNNPVVLPFTPKWIVIEVANGFGGFPGVPVPTIGILDFGKGNPGLQVPILEGIAIITDQTGVDGVHSRTYSFPYKGFKEGDRVWVRARDNNVGPPLSAPQVHNWNTDITFWR